MAHNLLLTPFGRLCLCRQKRREALMAEARRNIYGQLFQIREQEYTQEVSKAPADTYVIVHLSANTYEHTDRRTGRLS